MPVVIQEGLFREQPFPTIARKPSKRKIRPRISPKLLPERFQKAAEEILRLDRVNGQEWRAITLPPSGGGEHYDSAHSALVGMCYYIFNVCGVSTSEDDPEYSEARDYVCGQYAEGHGDADVGRQFADAIERATAENVKAPEGDEDRLTEEFDPHALRQHKRTEVSAMSGLSPEPPGDVTPEHFIRTLFSKEVLAGGYCGVTEQTHYSPLLLDPNAPEREHVDLSGYHFFNQSTFKEPERATKENSAHRAYMTFECDLKNEDFQERFVTFAMLVATSAPLVAVVDSGNKSLHFIFAINPDTPPKTLREFRVQGALHGADKKILRTKTSWVRMANVGASSGERRAQNLLYWNPDVLKTPCNWDVQGFTENLSFLTRVALWCNDGAVYYKLDDSSYTKVSDSNAIHLIAKSGLRAQCDLEVERLSPAHDYLLQRIQQNSVREVLKGIAGHHAGIINQADGSRYLVRYSPKFPDILDSPKEWPEIKKFLNELFEEIEYDVFMGWLSEGARACYNDGALTSDFTPSQFLNVVGQPNAGKTFLTEEILAKVFGNRMATCDGLFAEKDDVFNSNEASSELLILDDTKVLKDTDPSRANQGEVIKSLCVGGTSVSHAKGVDKISVRQFHRIIRFLNHDKIPSLPMVGREGMGDKVIILEALSRGERSTAWGTRMKKAFAIEIDAFFTYLIKEHETPEHVLQPAEDRRFPVISYKNPTILDSMHQDSKGAFIERLVAGGKLKPTRDVNGTPVFEGAQSDIYQYLKNNLTMSEADIFSRMFSSAIKLNSVLRELRDSDSTELTITHSSDGDHEPTKIGGGYYWRIEVPGEPIFKHK